MFRRKPTPGDLIAAAALDVMRGKVKGVPADDGMCLAFVRVVVQHALGLTFDEFYAHGVRVESKVQNRPWWARDMERGLRAKGWHVRTPRWGPDGDPARYAVTEERYLRPGDLLFRWDTAENAFGEHVGHVGIYMGGGLVMENIAPKYRHNSARLARHHSVSLTPLGDWPVTTIIRWRS